MEPSEVALAASLLLEQGRPGDVVTVGPDSTVYLYPFSLQERDSQAGLSLVQIRQDCALIG